MGGGDFYSYYLDTLKDYARGINYEERHYILSLFVNRYSQAKPNLFRISMIR